MCSGPFLFLISQRSEKLGTRLYPPLSITAFAAAAASAQWFSLTRAPDMFIKTSASIAFAAPRVGRPSSGVADRAVDLPPDAPQPLVLRSERVRVLRVPRVRCALTLDHRLVRRHLGDHRPAAVEVRLGRPAGVPVVDPAERDLQVRLAGRE